MTTISNILRVSVPLEFKRSADSRGSVSGYASTFNGEPDSYGDVIAPGAFAASLARHKADGTAPLMLWGHDPDRPVGRWEALSEDSSGLLVKGRFNLDTAAGHDAYAHVLAGDLGGLSIGYRTMPNGAKPGPNGSTILTTIDLKEVSIVGFPANRGARVTEVKSFSSQAELEAKLRTILPGRAVKKLMSGGWPALSREDDETANPKLDELLAAVKAARLEFRK